MDKPKFLENILIQLLQMKFPLGKSLFICDIYLTELFLKNYDNNDELALIEQHFTQIINNYLCLTNLLVPSFINLEEPELKPYQAILNPEIIKKIEQRKNPLKDFKIFLTLRQEMYSKINFYDSYNIYNKYMNK